MRASHTHCTHYADMRAFYEHRSFARTFFPFLRTPALRAVASIGEYWRGPTCSLHAHNACCMRAICSLQAFCKLWQAFYRAHIFIRVSSHWDTYIYTHHNHISGKKYKIFVPFQNGGQISDFHFASFWFRPKFEKNTFPKEFFNEIWLKLGDHDYINIAEIKFR